jgi:hypothetical protein
VGWDSERLKRDLPHSREAMSNLNWKSYLGNVSEGVLDGGLALPPQIPIPLESHREKLVALRTLKGWYDYFRGRKKEIPLMVNANWFSIQGPMGHPHILPFTYLMGLSVKKQKEVSPFGQFTETGGKLDALAVIDDGRERRVTIVDHAEMNKEQVSSFQFAVAGFSILKNDRPVVRKEMSANAGELKRRTGVGISADGKRLHLIVVETEINLAQLTELFIRLGDSHAINLDNSGSSQMVWKGTELTRAADTVDRIGLGNDRRHRPIPNFFGVGTKPIKKDKSSSLG